LLVPASLNDTPFDHGYVIGTDAARLTAGGWQQVFNSDAALYGGGNVGNGGATPQANSGQIKRGDPGARVSGPRKDQLAGLRRTLRVRPTAAPEGHECRAGDLQVTFLQSSTAGGGGAAPFRSRTRLMLKLSGSWRGWCPDCFERDSSHLKKRVSSRSRRAFAEHR
jgi:hypothetical protein